MARFEEAEKRNLDVKVCRKCGSRNPKKAERCRKPTCDSKQLRSKHKETKGK